MALTAVTVSTKVFDGMQPGTSGLRKSTKVFMQPNYTENFVQCTLSAMGDKLAKSTLAVGGDGRYYGKEATQKIIQMCAANGASIVSRFATPTKYEMGLWFNFMADLEFISCCYNIVNLQQCVSKCRG